MDRHEGVNSGSYIKETCDVFIEAKVYKCLVYIDPIIEEGIPKKEYINRINQGVLDANLSQEYVSHYIRKYIPER